MNTRKKLLMLGVLVLLTLLVTPVGAAVLEENKWEGGHHVPFSDVGCVAGEACDALLCTCFPDESLDGGYCGRVAIPTYCNWLQSEGKENNCIWLEYNESVFACKADAVITYP